MGSGLAFERIRVLRMPGVADGGFTLDGLSPGVNVVHGPNASGKTTSARAIELLLWPRLGAAERARLAGEFRMQGRGWSVELDGDRVIHQRDGAPVDPPTLPPADEHDRYRLALHDLLSTDNSRFAKAIVDESAGGYDVAAAGEALSPRSTASQCRNEREALRQARSALAEAVRRQEALRDEERRMGGLVEARSAADRAALRARLLEAALDHAAARADLETARAGVAGFPPAMARMRGDEHDRLQRIAAKLGEIETELATAEASRAAALAAIAASGLPDPGVGSDTIAALRTDLERLREAERDVAGAERSRMGSGAMLAEELARLGGALDEERLAALSHVAMEALADFARRAADLHATRATLAAEMEALGDPPPPGDPGRLDEGVRLLQRWLRQGSPEREGIPRGRALGLAGAGALAGLGIGLGLLDPRLFLLGALGAALMVLVLGRREKLAADPRAVHRREYEGLELERPAAWQPPEVERVLVALLDQQARAHSRAERARHRAGVAERLRLHEERMRELAAERIALAGRLGVAPETEEGHLYWLANRISRWQDARSALSAAEAELESARGRADALRLALRQRLSPFASSPLHGVGELAGAVDDLDQRRERHVRGRAALATADADRARLASAREERERERGEILDALGLDVAAAATVRDWCARFGAYEAARDADRQAATAVDSARRRLEAMEAEDALFDGSRLPLERELVEARERAAARDGLVKEITRIETLVEEAKRSHGIEAGLEQVGRCEQKLRAARARDTRAVLGQALLDFVQRATRDEHLPAVFHRARQIFSRITHGRYELRFDGEGEPGFRAWDNQEARGRALEELSSGSRVQLLLAVRVAFVEQQEQGVQLPLVLDEVLGNSDDERARAIMEAVVQLAIEGRQIFYFTAQADEVEKWRAVLHEHDGVGSRVIDLGEARGIERRLETRDLQLATPPSARVPEPGEADHLEYGRILGVPTLDRATAHAAEVHLWYLVEDPAALHGLLALGPRSWGALRGLVTNGGRALVAEPLVSRLEVLARAMETFLEESRIGVGRPVERATLVDASAISPIFLDRADAMREAVGGDAARILAAIDDRELAGFRREKAEELREYFEAQGYLDPRDPLGPGEVRIRVLSSVASDVEAGRITLGELDRLVLRLRGGLSEPVPTREDDLISSAPLADA